MSTEFLETDFDKVSYLVNLLTARATGLASDSGEFEALRSELLSNPNLAPMLPQWLRQHRNLDSFWGFIQPKFSSYAERRTYLSGEFTPILDQLEFGQPTQVIIPSSITNTPVPPAKEVPRNKRKVFIVHGHNNEVKQEVSRFVEQLGLEAIILHEQANAGMTIIEKIEHYSNDADFALVLYTPCDLGRAITEPNPPKNRARQNVVFEHGYLIAKLGRENVCPLVKGALETPNDISGVLYVTIDDPGAWKNQVAKELTQCGYTLKSFF
ncbi:nucleotide-binding protein [uncultured Shewanella sp.]|uniref:nucleotide-binding protein n=1 Tax=uncultured Shewanella sp. TaxID=173975 RepID=UPI002618AF64|nr:nucleotide-binding protein [uncultured Shewanella sp.]